MAAIPRLPNNSIDQLGSIIANNLTHRQIAELLQSHNIPDVASEGNKHTRVAKALVTGVKTFAG